MCKRVSHAAHGHFELLILLPHRLSAVLVYVRLEMEASTCCARAGDVPAELHRWPQKGFSEERQRGVVVHTCRKR